MIGVAGRIVVKASVIVMNAKMKNDGKRLPDEDWERINQDRNERKM